MESQITFGVANHNIT